MLVQGSAGASASPACSSSMEMPSGVRIKAMRHVTRRAVDRHAAGDKGVAGVVDVVHGICEMSEIAAAGVRLRIPVVGEFHGSRLVAGGGEEHVGVASGRRRISRRPSTSKKAIVSSSELTRIMVCKYLVMGCPPVSVFVAAPRRGGVR